LADTGSAIITVLEAGNQYPTLVLPYDSTAVNENATLSFRVRGIDPDSTIPVLRATNLPANATFTDSLNGRGGFIFYPDNFQAGDYTVYFQALDSDDTLVTTRDSIKITVLNVNQPPEFTRRIPTKIMNEGDTLVDSVMVVDDDLTIPILRMTTQLTNSNFLDRGNGTGVLTFYPDYTQGNSNPTVYSVSFVAIDSDDTTVVTQYQPATTISVLNVPMPPIVLPINDTSVVEDDTLRFFVYSTDPDGTIPTLSAFNLPANASFSLIGGSVGTFRFYPSFTQAGVYTVGFRAIDATALVDTELVQITVIEAGNQRPVLASISDRTIGMNNTLSFRISATDPDGTIPHLLADSLPRYSTFYDSLNGAGLFTFTPDSTQADSIYRVIFIASDDSLSDSALVTIAVIRYVAGDANGNGEVGVSDVVYLINYLFKAGPAPVPMAAGDANKDGQVTVADCVYLINYLFKGGPPP
jgi:hypothetical protein